VCDSVGVQYKEVFSKELVWIVLTALLLKSCMYYSSAVDLSRK